MARGFTRFLDPQVEQRILVERNERVLCEVRRHPVTRIVPVLEIIAGMGLFVAMPRFGHLWWIPLFGGLILGLHGFWRMHVEFMDRFVITNLRVFRVRGVIDQRFGMMPLARVLDVSVHQPFWGQVFNYGHLELENAAQEQALREIGYVGRVEDVYRVLQTAIIDRDLGSLVLAEDEHSSGT